MRETWTKAEREAAEARADARDGRIAKRRVAELAAGRVRAISSAEMREQLGLGVGPTAAAAKDDLVEALEALSEYLKKSGENRKAAVCDRLVATWKTSTGLGTRKGAKVPFLQAMEEVGEEDHEALACLADNSWEEVLAGGTVLTHEEVMARYGCGKWKTKKPRQRRK